MSLRRDVIRVRRDNGTPRDFRFADIARILHRTRFNRPSALEIFLKSGRTIFLDLGTQNSFSLLPRLKKLLPETSLVQTTPFPEFFASTSFTQDWLRGRISNFNYLSVLNMFSGRSFDDLTQYPIFPWILTDYSSDTLNIADTERYRDLAKPIADAPGDHYPMASEIARRCLGLLRPFSDSSVDPIESVAAHFADARGQKYCELVPEFFFSPEIFGETVELPPWSCDCPIAFVYLHRMALEGPYVTDHLHEWIDLVWGNQRESEPVASLYPATVYPSGDSSGNELSMVAGYAPHQLFTAPHPRRVWHCSRNMARNISSQLPVSSILFAAIAPRKLFVYDVTYVEPRGDIVRLRVNMVNAENQRSVTPKCGGFDVLDDGFTFKGRVSITQFGDFAGTLPPKSFRLFGNTLAIMDGHSPSISLVDMSTGSRNEIVFHTRAVVSIDQQDGWLVTAGRDALVNVFSVTELTQPVFTIPLYRDEITCCAVSAGFGFIASGTRDSFLVLSSLEKGSNSHVIDLGGRRPGAVLITKAWGFVVVCATHLDDGVLYHSISVYSPNGVLVRTSQMQEPITAWTTWSSTSGFDFLIVATEQGRLLTCEVFFLDFAGIKGTRVAAPIVGIAYERIEAGVVVVCANGEMLFVPVVTNS
jgi:hypothetical protein